MLREHSNILNGLRRFVDLVILFLSFLAAYHLRFGLFPLPEEMTTAPSLRHYLPNLALLLFLWLLVTQFSGLYSGKKLSVKVVDIRAIAVSLVSTLFFYAGTGFIFKSFDVSRLMLLIFAPLSALLLTAWHFFFQYSLKVKWFGAKPRNLLIIGAGPTARRFAYEIMTHRETGYQVLGFLDDESNANSDLPRPLLGRVSDIAKILANFAVDRVVVALSMKESRHLEQVVRECEYAGIEVNIIPDLFQFIHPRAKVLNLNGIPLIGVRPNPVDTWQYVYLKRAFDILFSLVFLVLVSPLMILIALLVKVTSKGPILFAQTRLGTQGRPFTIYKFRTMRVDSGGESDTRWTTPEDERVTPIGKILRRTSLDELPQFWNVLKGDMSVVGPRPERPYFAEKFRRHIPEYMIRHQVKTGLTGWAQVNGLRGDTSIEKRIQYDIFYIENWSFSFDLRIILLTLMKGLFNKNAY
ncbi:MAG: undecaprenyl-phosphate glucose phosphotransferase [candidate division KSB1 bacterium]|nr:undecaprenyl-phosphate glucose phosphotransferase [candidate division KSB1 bacterium]